MLWQARSGEHRERIPAILCVAEHGGTMTIVDNELCPRPGTGLVAGVTCCLFNAARSPIDPAPCRSTATT